MSGADLAGKRVVITVAEPSEFVREAGRAKFTGTIAEIDEERCVVTLDRPLRCGERTFLTAHCQTRHEGTSTSELESGGGVALNVTLLAKLERSLADVERCDFRDGYAVVAVVAILE